MFQNIKGFAQFISVERGLMLFMISIGVTFLIVETLAWSTALFLGILVFCIWSAVDAMNNIFDHELDIISDPARAKFTKKIGRIGFLIMAIFCVASLGLGIVTMIPYVVLFVSLGLIFGILYSVPPFRLRKTAYKPIVNFTVGAIPTLVIVSFFNNFSFSSIVLVVLIGITTAVNSLWEDLADFASDSHSGSRTVPIVFGFRKGLFLTIIIGYCMLPLMFLAGITFQLSWIYHISLVGFAVFISLRIIQKRQILREARKIEPTKLHKLGEILAKDFVFVAIAFTFSLMINSLLKIHPIFI